VVMAALLDGRRVNVDGAGSRLDMSVDSLQTTTYL